MSTGTYNTSSLVRELMDESFERAGMDPQVSVTGHIKSWFRSCRMMLNSEWATVGIRQWQILQASHTLSVGENFFNPPAGFLDITDAVLRRPGQLTTYADVEMYPITRNEWLLITNKLIQGRPDRFFVDRQAGVNTGTGLSNAIVNYWQAGSNTTDQIVYYYFHQDQDVSESLSDTLDIPVMAKEAFVAGMASKMALKWNPNKFTLLEALYRGPNWAEEPLNPGGALGALRAEDRERGDITLYAAFEPRTGRR
jgi:hypothetical protein